MKKSKFTETQIVKALKEHEGGRSAKDICRVNDEIDGPTYKKWNTRLRQERAVLEDSLNQMGSEVFQNRFDKIQQYLPLLSNLSEVFYNANFKGKQLLLNTVSSNLGLLLKKVNLEHLMCIQHFLITY